MSDFWGAVLGSAAPAPAAPQRPVLPPTRPYSPSPFFAPQTPAQPAQQSVSDQPQEHKGWGTVEGSMRKAQHTKQEGLCPNCASGNYFAPQAGGPARCFDCGYPVLNSTSGGGLPSDQTGAASPSRQIASGGKGGVSHFQPQNPAAGHI